MAGQTRERIMDVALKLFVEQGPASTPVTAIEAAAGLSAGSGSFYRHFADKAALLTAVVDRELARVGKDPAAQLVNSADPSAEALARQLLADLDFLRDLQPLIAILMWERGRSPELAEHIRKVMGDRGIELGIADLLLNTPAAPVNDDPAAAATVMQSAMIGYFLGAEYFGAPALEVSAERFTSMLARLLTDPNS